MKISKRQLRRIIKEEKAKVLAEQKVRHIVRRILIEQSEGPYPPGYHVIEFSDGKQYVDSWVKKQGRPPLMGLYHDFKTSRNKIVSVEEPLYESMQVVGSDKNFKGFIDLVLKTKDGKYHVIDWKTCSWGWDLKRKTDKITTYLLYI